MTVQHLLREQQAFSFFEPSPPVVRDSDVAISPPWVARWLGDWPDLDPCAHWQQVVQARIRLYIDGDPLYRDGLASPWVDRLNALWNPLGLLRHPPRIWVNPPYSKPHPWVVRAVEAADAGASVVLLLPADVTPLWAAACMGAVAVYGGWAAITRRRERFGLIKDGQPHTPPVFGAAARTGSLIVAIGQRVPMPPRDRVYMLEAPSRPVVPMLAGCTRARD